MSETENRRRAEDRLTDEIVSLETRFDRHLEIYRENGIESKRVADILEKMLLRADERDIKVDTMYAQYLDEAAVDKADARRMKTIVLWGATIAATGVILALVRQVLIA